MNTPASSVSSPILSAPVLSAPVLAGPILSTPVLAGPVVSTQWVADHLGGDGLVLLDASVLRVSCHDGSYGWLSGHDQYLITGHVPGTIFADLLEVFSDPNGRYGFAKPSAEQFEQAAASVGIDNETTVVVYDSAAGQWAARIWWLFRAFGYDRVAVLDGGFTKWNLEGRPTELGHIEPRTTAFVADPRPELWVDKAYVQGIVAGTEDAALVCGVPPKEFSGEDGYRSRSGHIPGSFSVPAGRLVEREGAALLSTDALAAKFAPALAKSRRIVTYCGGGIAAAADALVLTLIGERNVAVYDGSLNEWVADPDAPLVTT